MFTEMACDRAGVNIEPTARFVGDDEANGFTAVKVVLSECRMFSQENSERKRNQQKFSFVTVHDDWPP